MHTPSGAHYWSIQMDQKMGPSKIYKSLQLNTHPNQPGPQSTNTNGP